MGDLSGGQILKKAAAKMIGNGDGRGVEFYEFPGIPEPGKFKKAYREKLDSLPVDEKTAAKIVEEANLAFSLNRDIFNSL
jgi:heme oxygenase